MKPFKILQKFKPALALKYKCYCFLAFGVFLLLNGGLLLLSGCQTNPASLPEKKHLQLSTWGSNQEITVTKMLIKRFEQLNPGVTVDLLHIPDNYFQKIHLLAASDLLPDVVFVNSFNFPVFADHGLFMDLKPAIEQQQLQTEDFYPQGLSAFQWTIRQNRQRIQGAIPRDLSNLVVYLNTDLLNRQHIPFPQESWHWETFLDVAKQLTIDANGDKTPEQFGVSFFTKPPLFWMPFVWSAGGDLLNMPGTALRLDEPAAIEGIQFYTNLRNKWHVAPTKIESGNRNMSELFLQGKLGMMISGRWSVPVLRETAKFHWDVLPLPVGPPGHSRVGIDASGYAISAKTKHPHLSIRLVAFLTSEEALKAVVASGLIVPARKSIAESSLFLNASQPPRHGRVFLDSIPEGVPTQSHPRWNEFSEELQLALEPVWDGEQTPDQALKTAKPALQAILEVH
jgi:multiple sugar transport system substrate-binding protein